MKFAFALSDVAAVVPGECTAAAIGPLLSVAPAAGMHRCEQSRARVPGSVQGILIHSARHPSTALPEAPSLCDATRTATPAGSGVVDAVNKNSLNGVGDPTSGCTRH